MFTSDEVLAVLDRGADAFVLPMLDNGYIYLAATRLTLFRSTEDWAIVFEVFGFSPRAGLPDVTVTTFGSRLRDQAANDDSRSFYPLAEGRWQDPDSEDVASDADEVLVRGESVRLPTPADLARHDIQLSAAPRISVFELCRFLAATHREQVLATPEERRVSVPEHLVELLSLDEWNHPDLAESEIPSSNETFQQLARVLSSGNLHEYRPSAKSNTHWRNWPEGGTL